MLKKCLYFTIVVCIFTLTGCVTNVGTNQMVSAYPMTGKLQNRALRNGITVAQVSGRQETNPFFDAKINNANFKAALVESLQDESLYDDYEDADYELYATLVDFQEPVMGGLDLTVTCKVHYLLKNVTNKDAIYDKTITSVYTAKLSDSIIAITRLKMASEGAARANIRKLIADLYQLPT